MKIDILKDTTYLIPKKMTDNFSEKLLYMPIDAPVYQKQRVIIEFLNTRPECTATLDEMLEHNPTLCNCYRSKKYLCETMSRMVKKKLVIRVGRGKYKSNCCGMERPKKKSKKS